MTALNSLKILLEEGFVRRKRHSGENATKPLTRTLHILRLACDHRHGAVPTPGATHALFAFRMGESVQDFLALKQLCANATKEAGWDTRRLIDDPRLFSSLLQQIGALHTDPKRFVKCYRALLASYFSYPALSLETNAAGRSNWQALGAFLRKHLNFICAAEKPARWIITLRENAELLDTPPPPRIRAADLESRTAIQRQLGIPASGGFFSASAVSGKTNS